MEENNEIYPSAPQKKASGKYSFLAGFLTGLCTSLVLLLVIGLITGILVFKKVTSSSSQTANAEQETETETETDDLDYERIEAKLKYLMTRIQTGYLFDYDTKELEEGIYKGFIEALGDPYSVYYTEKEYQELVEANDGSYCGIGVSISQNAETKLITIIRVFRGSGAEESGLLPEDIIYKVDGEDITSQDINTVVSKIRGEENTNVEVTVYRPSLNDYVTVQIQRRVVQQDICLWEMKEDGIGYIQILEFDKVTVEQFHQAVEELKSQGMTSMIIDVRDNPGGIVDSVVEICDDLLDEGLVVSMKYRDESGEEYNAEDGMLFDGPIAVLVNGNSASASEILTGALKDYDRATIIGTQTFGKGIVQIVADNGDGSGLKMTIADYFTPNGSNIHGIGITPDIILEYEKSEDGTDNQLEKAIEVLKSKN